MIYFKYFFAFANITSASRIWKAQSLNKD